MNTPRSYAQSDALTAVLCGEFFKALGFSTNGLFSKVFSPLITKAISKFSVIASGFDQRIGTVGFQAASKWFLPNFIEGMKVVGNEDVPKVGPLLIASNHPGAYDALVIAANIPRDDIKIIVNIPPNFISELPLTLPHFIYAPMDPHIRIKVVRSAIEHLQNNGSLLIFASGGMDPDPESMTGACEEIQNWSRSLEIFIRKVPSTQLLLTMVSGILSPRYVNHLFTKFQRERIDKQRISEFFQLMRQVTKPGILKQNPKISFSQPLTLKDLTGSEDCSLLIGTIKRHAQHLLEDHCKSLYT